MTLPDYMRRMFADSEGDSDRKISNLLLIAAFRQIKAHWRRVRREYAQTNPQVQHRGNYALIPFAFAHPRMLPTVLAAFQKIRADAERRASTIGGW